MVTFKVGTPHPVTLLDADGVPVTLKPHRTVRVDRPGAEEDAFEVDGHRFRRFQYTVLGLKGLPDPEPDVYWIVSTETAREGRHFRDDLVAPYLPIRERDHKVGRDVVVACRGLVRYTSGSDMVARMAGVRPQHARGAETPGPATNATAGALVPESRGPDEWVDVEDREPTPEELDAREAALDAQYDLWADEDAQTVWVQQQVNDRTSG